MCQTHLAPDGADSFDNMMQNIDLAFINGLNRPEKKKHSIVQESDVKCSASVTVKEHLQMNHIIIRKHHLFASGRGGAKIVKWN